MQKNISQILEETSSEAFPFIIATDYETGTLALDTFAVTIENDVTIDYQGVE
jgi:hypothetical protein